MDWLNHRMRCTQQRKSKPEETKTEIIQSKSKMTKVRWQTENKETKPRVSEHAGLSIFDIYVTRVLEK